MCIILDLPETTDDETLLEAADVAQAKLAAKSPADNLPSDSEARAALTRMLGLGATADFKDVETAAGNAVIVLHGIKMLSADERSICKQLGMAEKDWGAA